MRVKKKVLTRLEDLAINPIVIDKVFGLRFASQLLVLDNRI